MSDWTLSVDFGTSATAAAISDADGVVLVEFAGSARVPSVVAALEDGTLVAGDTAVRQQALAPDAVERAPKRRLGDRAVLLGDRPVAPAALAATVLRLVADEAARRRGGTAPSALRLTHPASWASTRLEALRAAAAQAGLPEPSFLTEPVAAAMHLGDSRVQDGEHVAVYDLGGGTFDAAVLRRTGTGYELVGPPGGNDRVGGEDVDERLLEHVGQSIREQDAEAWERLRFSDERAWRRAAAALRTDVRAAKEQLSSAPHATVYVPAPVDLEVRVTREELEGLVRSDLERTVDELVATVERAGLGLTDLSAVFLVGGGSRMPLVGRLVAERTGVVPTTWGDPKASVVLGAAGAAGAALATSDQSATAVLPVVRVPVQAGGDAHAADPAPPAAPRQRTAPAPSPGAPPVATTTGRSRRLLLGAVAGVVALVAVATTGVAVLRGDDGPPSGEATQASSEQPLPAYAFATAEDAGVRSQRTWTLDEDRTTVSNTTELTNPGTTRSVRTALEVVPKELAATVADVDFQPGFVVVQDDPVVRYDIALDPGQTTTLTWSVTLDQAADQAELDRLADAQRAAERAFAPQLTQLVAPEVLAAAPPVPFPTGADPGVTTSPAPDDLAVPAPGTVPGGEPQAAAPQVQQPGVSAPVTGQTQAGVSGGAPPAPVRTSSAPAQPAQPQQPAPPQVHPPGPVATGSVRFVAVTERESGKVMPRTVVVSASWQAASGSGVSYELRRSDVDGSGRSTVRETTPVSGTSTQVQVPACHIGFGRYAWEVRAVNGAGASSWSTLAATTVDMRGQYAEDATQMVRTAGALVAYPDAGGTRAPSGDQAWKVYNQNPVSGTVAAGSSVSLWYYGDP